jgi:hypothetical protein
MGHFEIFVKALVLGPQTSTLPNATSEGAHLWLFDARAGACWFALDTARARLGPCGSMGAEAIFASGFGSNVPSNATAAIAALAAGLGAEVSLTSRLSLTTALDAVLPFHRPNFFIDIDAPQDVVFRLPAVAGRASIGVIFHF